MRTLTEIWGTYREINDRLVERQRRARSKAGQDRWAHRRNVNDQAYFVMLFACLDERVTTLCRILVARKQSLRSWRQRRLWDAVDAGRLEFMRFMQRVALVVEKGSADFGRIRTLYDARCYIAHGAFGRVAPMNLPSQYQQIVRLWRALRP